MTRPAAPASPYGDILSVLCHQSAARVARSLAAFFKLCRPNVVRDLGGGVVREDKCPSLSVPGDSTDVCDARVGLLVMNDDFLGNSCFLIERDVDRLVHQDIGPVGQPDEVG